MPTYGYECNSCGNGFEVIQKFTDNALESCEKCGGGLKKKIFPVGIVFKGSGFYVNDYAAKGKSSNETTDVPQAVKTDEPAAADAPAKPDATVATETKPSETKSESQAPAAAPAATAP